MGMAPARLFTAIEAQDRAEVCVYMNMCVCACVCVCVPKHGYSCLLMDQGIDSQGHGCTV